MEQAISLIEQALSILKQQVGQPAPAPEPVGQLILRSTTSLNIRSGPSVDYPAFTYLQPGEKVIGVGRDGNTGWYKIQRANGQTGWCSHKYLEVLSGDESFVPI